MWRCLSADCIWSFSLKKNHVNTIQTVVCRLCWSVYVVSQTVIIINKQLLRCWSVCVNSWVAEIHTLQPLLQISVPSERLTSSPLCSLMQCRMRAFVPVLLAVQLHHCCRALLQDFFSAEAFWINSTERIVLSCVSLKHTTQRCFAVNTEQHYSTASAL